MLHFLFLILFFAQAQFLQADEFPNLLKHVDITWGDQLLTSQLNPRQTMSIDGEVPSFIFCGPFETSGGDGKCRLQYHYEYYPSISTWSEGTGVMPAMAKLISMINETYSCMSFEMPIDDFVTIYKKTELSSSNDYGLSYECETIPPIVTQPGLSPFIYLGIAVFMICCSGWMAYNCGKNAHISGGNGGKETTVVIDPLSTGRSYKKVEKDRLFRVID